MEGVKKLDKSCMLQVLNIAVPLLSPIFEIKVRHGRRSCSFNRSVGCIVYVFYCCFPFPYLPPKEGKSKETCCFGCFPKVKMNAKNCHVSVLMSCFAAFRFEG